MVLLSLLLPAFNSHRQSALTGADILFPFAALTIAIDFAMRFTYSGQSIVLRRKG
jgi:hypothetical protein